MSRVSGGKVMRPKTSISIPQPSRETSKETKNYADFKEEIDGKEVIVQLWDGHIKKGRILEVRPYFVKFRADEGVLYINKAFIAFIRVS